MLNTLLLQRPSDMQEYLEEAGIVPSNTKTYATSDIEDALAKAWGAKPEIMCACGKAKWRKTCDTALIDSVSCEAGCSVLQACPGVRPYGAACVFRSANLRPRVCRRRS